jgi:hypothetical protein
MRTPAVRTTLAAAMLALAFAAPAAAAPPENDDFARAEQVSGDFWNVFADNLEATREPDEPRQRGTPPKRSLWYRWVAPASGTVQLEGYRRAFNADNPRVAAYTGVTLGTLDPVTEVSSTYEFPWLNLSELRFEAVAGTAYHIALDQDAQFSGAIGMWAMLFKPPPNDDFAHAEPLAGLSGSATGDSRGSTMEPGEAGRADGSIWYEWTALTNDTVAFDTAGSDSDTVLSIYTGASADGLTRVAWNDNAGPSRKTSRVAFRAVLGTTYRIQVSSYHFRDHGPVKLALTTRPPPANDDFAAAEVLPSAESTSARGHNDAATKEAEEFGPAREPARAANEFGAATHAVRNSVWYSWTAPADGSLTVRASAEFRPLLAVRTGETVSSSTLISNEPQNPSGPAAEVRVPVQAGHTYRISIDTAYPDSTGDFDLTLALDRQRVDDHPNEDPSPAHGEEAPRAGTAVPDHPPGSNRDDSQPSSGPAAFAMSASFRRPKLSTLLSKGVTGRATCNRDCKLEAVVILPGATKRARATARVWARAGERVAIRVRLPNAVRRHLQASKSTAPTVQLAARAGVESAVDTWRIEVRR